MLMFDLVVVFGLFGWEGGVVLGGEGCNVDYFCVCIELFDEVVLVVYFEGFGLVLQVFVEICFGVEGDGWLLYFFDLDGN